MSRNNFLGLCLLMSIAGATRCEAKECDPLEILIKDTSSSVTDQQRKSTKDTSKDTSTRNKESSSGGVNFIDILTAQGDQADDFSTALREKFHLDFSARDRK